MYVALPWMWRTPVVKLIVFVCNECERDSESKDWKREMVSCNFLNHPCLIMCDVYTYSVHQYGPAYTHSYTLHIHIMQYAMHCNLVILHGRLFPINATHTKHFSLSLQFFFIRSTLCMHEKVSIACFHQPDTAKDMTFFRCFTVVVFIIFPICLPQFVIYTETNKKININKSKYSYSYLPFRSVLFLQYIIHFQCWAPKTCFSTSIFISWKEKEKVIAIQEKKRIYEFRLLFLIN